MRTPTAAGTQGWQKPLTSNGRTASNWVLLATCRIGSKLIYLLPASEPCSKNSPDNNGNALKLSRMNGYPKKVHIPEIMIKS